MADALARAAPGGLIPLAAAGRDDVFVFGTLVHHEVLELVVDRSVAPGELVPAVLAGHRRETAAGASYPVLVADPVGAVDGRLLRRPSLRDIQRLNHYEADEYAAAQLVVTVAARPQPAWVFMALDHLVPSGEPWDLERWAAAHLEQHRRRLARWMAEAPI